MKTEMIQSVMTVSMKTFAKLDPVPVTNLGTIRTDSSFFINFFVEFNFSLSALVRVYHKA